MKRQTNSYATNLSLQPITSRTMPRLDRRTNIIDSPTHMDSTSPRIQTTRRWIGSVWNRLHDETGMMESWDYGTNTKKPCGTDGNRASRIMVDERGARPRSAVIHNKTEATHLIPILGGR